ncbi:MAG: 4-hydroxy-3-methylbut-2-enyl diphosphate reductase [Armatimonadota bacterium]
MKITVAEEPAFCFGVRRALRMVRKTLDLGREVLSLGPLIHNPQVVGELEELGLRVVSDVSEAASGTVVIRTHGAPPDVLAEAQSKGLEVIDATCPFVKRAQRAAAEMQEQGCTVIVLGERDHPETIAILAHTDGEALVAESVADAKRALAALDRRARQRLGLVAQTTQPAERFAALAAALLPLCDELRAANTVCDSTERRQAAASALAQQADVMIVVGGLESANTRRLAEICRSHTPATHHIQTADEVQREWLRGAEHVGVTGGASTPPEAIEAVRKRLEELT